MPRVMHLPLLSEAMRFAIWASQRPRPPSWREVQGFLGCTATKARTWRCFYLRAIPLADSTCPAATGTTQQQENHHE